MNKSASLVLLLLALAGCSSTKSRIKRNQAAFDAFPPEIQQKIRDRAVEPGMTAQMVEIALGKPDRTYTRSTAERKQEIWAYGGRRGPSIGLGVGVASGFPTVYGGGVGVGTGDPYALDDRERVVFEDGRVVSVERRER